MTTTFLLLLSRHTQASSAAAAAAAAAKVALPPLLQRRAYHPRVVDHYENPRNVGSLDDNNDNKRRVAEEDSTVVGTGIVGAPACGDVMKLQIAVDERTGVIRDARFKTFGCGSAIASSSLATEWIKGRPLEQAERIRNADIARYLHLPPVKLHCSMLAQDAIAQSVRDARDKKEKSVDGMRG